MEMCSVAGMNLQRGMNFRLREEESTILMSVRPGAPYADRVEDEGRVLVYEGHDVAKTVNGPHPKQVDQPERNPGGSLTQNGLFAEAVRRYQRGDALPESVRVYEKIRAGIWVYNGLFQLVDCWTEESGVRKVFKFKLELAGGAHDFALTFFLTGYLVSNAALSAIRSANCGSRRIWCNSSDNACSKHLRTT